MIKIEPICNGALVIHDGIKESFQYDDDNIRGLKYLLYCIADELKMNQKYNKENIEIRIVHGRGYECKDKKCEVCNDKTA